MKIEPIQDKWLIVADQTELQILAEGMRSQPYIDLPELRGKSDEVRAQLSKTATSVRSGNLDQEYVAKIRPPRVTGYCDMLNEMDAQGYELHAAQPVFVSADKGEMYMIFRRKETA
jgi:hypothetical protein